MIVDLKDAITALRKLDACSGAVDWLETFDGTWQEAWNECPRGDWLLWLPERLCAGRKTIVLAACDCASLALPYAGALTEVCSNTIGAARSWTRGECSLDDVRAAWLEAERAAWAEAGAAANAAWAAVTAAEAAWAARADRAATWAAWAAEAATLWAAGAAGAEEARHEQLALCADIVRQYFPVAPALSGVEQ